MINLIADCGDVEVGKIGEVSIKNSYGDIKIKSIKKYVDIVAECGDVEINSIIVNRKIKFIIIL